MVWTDRISAPFINKSVAKLWRRVCGETCFVMPAFRAYFCTKRSIDRAESRRKFPLVFASPVFELLFKKRGARESVRAERYSETQSAAAGEIKTGRSLLPLPRTINSRRSRLIESRLSFTSSETRSPPENKSSIMARSRKPVSVEVSISDNRRSTSS